MHRQPRTRPAATTTGLFLLRTRIVSYSNPRPTRSRKRISIVLTLYDRRRFTGPWTNNNIIRAIAGAGTPILFITFYPFRAIIRYSAIFENYFWTVFRALNEILFGNDPNEEKFAYREHTVFAVIGPFLLSKTFFFQKKKNNNKLALYNLNN